MACWGVSIVKGAYGPRACSVQMESYARLMMQAAFSDFRSGKAQVLVATDVAARGLHIRALPYVVNYDFPTTLEAYIHRAGRTGRLAANGHCFSFFSRALAPLARPLLHLMEVRGEEAGAACMRTA